jgi:membrane fusion protein (multidrug efflux system)
MSAAKQKSASRLPGGLKGWLGAAALLLGVVLVFGVLAAWKYANIQQAMAAAADQPEPMETITIATASPREHRQTVTSIGTVLALRSITLKNEMPGTVQEVKLTPGQIVEAGDVLVALDVSVEQAELKAHEAEAALAETVLSRYERAGESHAVSMIEIDRARAQRDVAVAQIARIKAIIDRKTIFAPFKARVGMADVHPGQYLEEGTELTTLQGIEDPPAVHVDFTVTQQVAGGLAVGDDVDVIISNQLPSAAAKIIAIDARVDQATRNAWVRARLESPPADTGKAAELPAPGA